MEAHDQRVLRQKRGDACVVRGRERTLRDAARDDATHAIREQLETAQGGGEPRDELPDDGQRRRDRGVGDDAVADLHHAMRARPPIAEHPVRADVQPDAMAVSPFVGRGTDRNLARGGHAADADEGLPHVRCFGGELCRIRDLLPWAPPARLDPGAGRRTVRRAVGAAVQDLGAREGGALLDQPRPYTVAGRDAGDEYDSAFVARDAVGAVAEGGDLEHDCARNRRARVRVGARRIHVGITPGAGAPGVWPVRTSSRLAPPPAFSSPSPSCTILRAPR